MRKFQNHKYKAKPQKIDGQYFSSKKEAKYYGELKLRQMAGEVSFFLCQVPFDLPGGIKYRLDFMEFWSNGCIKYIDVKGYDTPISKLKRKQVEDLYPIKIEVK